jgi:hypothetical protein
MIATLMGDPVAAPEVALVVAEELAGALLVGAALLAVVAALVVLLLLLPHAASAATHPTAANPSVARLSREAAALDLSINSCLLPLRPSFPGPASNGNILTAGQY